MIVRPKLYDLEGGSYLADSNYELMEYINIQHNNGDKVRYITIDLSQFQYTSRVTCNKVILEFIMYMSTLEDITTFTDYEVCRVWYEHLTTSPDYVCNSIHDTKQLDTIDKLVVATKEYYNYIDRYDIVIKVFLGWQSNNNAIGVFLIEERV